MSGDNAPKWRYRTRPDTKAFERIPNYDYDDDDDSNDSDDSIKFHYNSIGHYKKPVILNKDKKNEPLEDIPNENTLPTMAPLETSEETFYSNILGSLEGGLRFLICHPCNVIRRQCQVHQFAKSLHLQPFTLIPVICRSISNDVVLLFFNIV